MTGDQSGLKPSASNGEDQLMSKFESILVPLDFSDCSREALKHARDLVDKFGSKLHVLHVIHDLSTELPDFGMGLAFPAFLEDLSSKQEELEEAALNALAREVDPAWQKGKHVTLATRQGPPFVEIVRYAREHAIGLIVMGTHGRSGLTHALLGSVTEKVLRKAPCPVLTVRPANHQFEHP